ncbi:hypothetical protein [Corticicoccus populi]|uniref:Uncharacterized protein n=1 Tax=Corticicoccus populi TaxID=1812821 RepID=A0ABW5WSX1_9STAP
MDSVFKIRKIEVLLTDSVQTMRPSGAVLSDYDIARPHLNVLFITN